MLGPSFQYRICGRTHGKLNGFCVVGHGSTIPCANSSNAHGAPTDLLGAAMQYQKSQNTPSSGIAQKPLHYRHTGFNFQLFLKMGAIVKNAHRQKARIFGRHIGPSANNRNLIFHNLLSNRSWILSNPPLDMTRITSPPIEDSARSSMMASVSS